MSGLNFCLFLLEVINVVILLCLVLGVNWVLFNLFLRLLIFLVIDNFLWYCYGLKLLWGFGLNDLFILSSLLVEMLVNVEKYLVLFGSFLVRKVNIFMLLGNFENLNLMMVLLILKEFFFICFIFLVIIVMYFLVVVFCFE